MHVAISLYIYICHHPCFGSIPFHPSAAYVLHYPFRDNWDFNSRTSTGFKQGYTITQSQNSGGRWP